MNNMVSVIIPVYNVEQYIQECVKSVTEQTYTNLEVILIDDGSTDKSGLLIDAFAEKDSRIKVIHKLNEGVSEARNTGLRICKGNYIGFVDADDWCEPNMYQALIESIIANKADISTCGYIDYPNGMDRPIKKGLMHEKTRNNKEAVIPLLSKNGYFTSVCNKLFRREVIFQANGPVLMDIHLFYGEDEEWLFRILKNCNLVSFVPVALYHWRSRIESMTRFENMSEKQMSLLLSKEKMLSYLPQTDEIVSFAKGYVFNDCHILKIWAYLKSDKKAYQCICAFLRPLYQFWIHSRGIIFPRKIKVIILEIMMGLKLPKTIIRKISSIR